MKLGLGFAPVEKMTVSIYARRLRVAVALGDQVRLSMTPEEALSLAQDLERMAAGAEAYLAGEVARIEEEATEAATDAAMGALSNSMTKLNARLEAEKVKAKNATVWLVLSLLAGSLMAALIMWGR